MLMHQYDVLTTDNQHITVYAKEHTLEDGVLTLLSTHTGMHFDVFPSWYWSRFMVDGVEQTTEETKEPPRL